MTNQPISVLILGATSGIAQATARIYAAERAVIGLAGRNQAKLETVAADLRTRGASRVDTFLIDFCVAEAFNELPKMVTALGKVDHILHAYGVLGDQVAAEQDATEAKAIIETNFSSAAVWVLASAHALSQSGRGSLVVLGSVAGDRGRKGNYIYGASKAGLATLVEGVSHRFGNAGPRAVIVKPGPTDTAMTADMAKGGPLWAKPEVVATIVRKAADRGPVVVYAPRRWRFIMAVIRSIPTTVFNKLNF